MSTTREDLQPEQERQDAERLERAIQLFSGGQFPQAHELLSRIVAGAPEEHVGEFEHAGTVYVKAWTQGEFEQLQWWREVHGDSRPHVRLRAVYPAAFYYLAVLANEGGDGAAALEYLERAMTLDPTHPQLLNELGITYAGLGDHNKAVLVLRSIPKGGPRLTSDLKASALRSEAASLVELAELDAAEAVLHESLELEPESERAVHELDYIRRVRLEGMEGSIGFTGAPEPAQGTVHGQEVVPQPTKAKSHWLPDFIFGARRRRQEQRERDEAAASARVRLNMELYAAGAQYGTRAEELVSKFIEAPDGSVIGEELRRRPELLQITGGVTRFVGDYVRRRQAEEQQAGEVVGKEEGIQ